MDPPSPQRLFSIGEFASATQLTPKALRLYDEQGILRPASIDPANGYRYYQSTQVAVGRLIRSLRDMSLSLQQIDQVLKAGPRYQEILLREYLRESEARLARERVAYQSALLMMNVRTAAPTQSIVDQTIDAQVVSVWEATCNRRSFNERYRECEREATRHLTCLGISRAVASSCVLLEPLTDEEARVEFRIPIDLREKHSPEEIVLRSLPQRRCALLRTTMAAAHEGFTSAVDALFDWFDRHGAHPLGHPEVLLHEDDVQAAIVRWTIADGQRGETR